MKLLGVIGAIALCLQCAMPAFAQDAVEDFAAGKSEYLAACAACHGENADGNGPIATMFKTRVPDLRKISASNDGEFPTLAIFQIVDGRTQVRGHGNPMPVFGNRFKTETIEVFGFYGSEQAARARVLELVFYLQSIQE